ncbi:hypothetical protein [Parabacteroides goldsteinii]|uniref:hypothetical protein n=1 Tax=Parabacteroides goldsteinii TaxID=328812 RepID=UPI00258B2178|nr:hypothetical protein [Parabacteroides goldsteinii]
MTEAKVRRNESSLFYDIHDIYRIYCIYHIYSISLPKIPTNKRKVIDLKDDTFRSLSVMAAQQGTNLKRLIESLLDRTAEEYNDTAMYRMLSEQRPEGKIKLNPQEKKDFENWLGLDIK